MKMIPCCRNWRVKVWHPDGSITSIVVVTINKRFAKWEAIDQIGHLRWYNRTKDTVSLVQQPKK